MKTPLLLIFWAFSAFADDFSMRAKSLQESQAATDVLLTRLKSKYQTSTGFPLEHSDHDSKPVNLLVRHNPLGRLRASVGTILPVTLINRLVIGGDPAPVLLQIASTETAFNDLLLLGVAKPAGTEGRISIEVNRVVFRSGKTHPLQAIALDEDGAFGLAAQVISKKAIAVAGAMASSFVSGLAASQITQSQTAFGVTTQTPSGRNAILQGVAQTAADQSKRLIEESTSEKPILILEAGARIKVFLNEEVRF